LGRNTQTSRVVEKGHAQPMEPYDYREFFNFVDQFIALCFTVTHALLAVRQMNFADKSACLMLITFGMKGSN
jgi:hypothetical protein